MLCIRGVNLAGFRSAREDFDGFVRAAGGATVQAVGYVCIRDQAAAVDGPQKFGVPPLPARKQQPNDRVALTLASR